MTFFFCMMSSVRIEKYGGGVMVMCYKSFNATHLVNYADKIDGVL